MREITNATTEQLIKFTTFNGLYTEDVMRKLQKQLQVEKEVGRNKPYYRAYLNIVKKSANLIKALGLEDPFTKCSFFYYLLWLGMFSKNQSFTFNEQERISDISALGADIMLGKAACLNNSDMLSRLLRATGTESYIIGCDVPDIKANPTTSSSSYLDFIEECENNRDFASLNLFAYGNHALSIFAYQNTYYLADPTNLTFLSITDFLEATYASEKVKAILKPAVSLVLEDVDPKHFKDIIIRSFIYSDSKPINADFINHHSDISKVLIAQNINTINHFYESIKPEIDIVCKTLK